MRRRITREVDLQIADIREEILNDLLTQAFQHFAESLTQGKTLELEPAYEEFVGQVLREKLDVKLER